MRGLRSGGLAFCTWSLLLAASARAGLPPVDMAMPDLALPPDMTVAVTAKPDPLDFGQQLVRSSQTRQVTIANAGSSSVDVSTLVVSGAAFGDYTVVAPSLPATVASGASLILDVKFVPSARGSRAAQLTITTTSTTVPTLTVGFAGVGVGGTLGVQPSPLDFGSVIVNTPTQKQLVLSNSGDLDLKVTSLTVSGANSSEFVAAPVAPVTIRVGGSVMVSFTFTAKAGGPRAAVATIASNDPFFPSVDVPLTGAGLAPMIAVTPSPADFGLVKLLTTASLQLTLKNNGASTLDVSSVSLAGANASAFALSGVTPPLSIAPGGQRSFGVSFTPIKVQSYVAAVAVTSSDPMQMSLNVPLMGDGASPGLDVTPRALAFGGQVVQHRSAGRTFQIVNNGAASLTVNAISLTGADAGAFSFETPPVLPLRLAPGAKQGVTIYYRPIAAAAAAAVITVDSDDASHPQAQVKLSGSGATDALAVSPAMIDYGTIAPQAFVTRTVMITNTGGDALQLGDGELGGAQPQAFLVDGVAGVLAAGETKMFNVQYHPRTGGRFEATLTLRPSDPALPVATVKLLGQAGGLLAVAPLTLDFGDVTVGSTAIRTVSVKNLSERYIQVTAAVTDNPRFSVVTGFYRVPPSAEGSINVAFTPTKEGVETTTVSVVASGEVLPVASIATTGKGVPAMPTQAARGCGCALGASGETAAPALTAAALLLLVLALRRRARSRGDRV